MPSQTRSPATEAEFDAAGTAWDTYTNALAEDGTSDSVTLPSQTASNSILVTNFGFSIPSDATINGVLAEVKKAGGDGVIDDEITLWSGTVLGVDHGDFVTSWPASLAYSSYGGSTDLWSATITPAMVNASDFGCKIGAYADWPFSRTALIDHIRLTVYYTEAPGPPPTILLPARRRG